MNQPYTVASILLAASVVPASASAPPITIEGRFDDWSDRPVTQADPRGDGPLDITSLKLGDEPDWFQFLIESPVDFDLSEGNELVLLIDTDNDASTGLQIEGIEEGFTQMQTDLESEKSLMQRI